MLTQNMRPKFSSDTYYIPLHDGVYLRSNKHQLILKGKSLYHLLAHLVPLLDGNATFEEILEGLNPDKKKMVTKLIEKLFAHHFLKDTNQDQFHSSRPEELAIYASDITFIDSFQASAIHRFECFRNKQFLIIGSGLSFTSLIQASLRCGIKQIDLLVTPDNEDSPRSHSDILASFSTYDSTQTLQVIDAPCWDDESAVSNTIQAYDAVLHISERPMLARAKLLNKLCVEQQKTLIYQAIIIDDHVWVGPLVTPDTEGCWECAWRRLQANLPDASEQLSRYEFRDQPVTSTNRSLTMSIATIAANRLIFEVFKYFTQIGSTNATRNLIAIDLETSQSENHAFLPHPHCQACQHLATRTALQFLEQIQQLQRQEPIDPDTFSANIARCTDTRLGLFTTIDDGNFIQAPLAIYQAHLSNPMLRQCQSHPHNIVAGSIDTIHARIRVSQRACERYAANLFDQRRLLSNEIAQLQGLPFISTSQLVAVQQPLAETEMWTWALNLHTQQAYLVPATQTFCSHSDVTRRTESEHGIASGMIWEEAICQALLDWCNYLTVKQLNDAQHLYIQVDLANSPMTSEGRHLYHLLTTAIEQITIYDVTGTLQVPTFAICLNEKVVTYSTHCDVALALTTALERALQHYQSQQCQQPEYALAPVPDLSSTLRSNQSYIPHYTPPATWSARMNWLLQTLQANALHALALPLDHDPALAQILPYIVRVLLTRTEVKDGQ